MTTGKNAVKSRKQIRREHRREKRGKPPTWCKVYAIQHGRTGPVVYVGQTRLAIEERLRWHYRQVRQGKAMGKRLSPFHRWLDSASEKGLEVHISCVDRNGVWDVSEAVWIDRMIAAGHPLLNVRSVVGWGNERLKDGMVVWGENSIEVYA
jgi:hypothetical protein